MADKKRKSRKGSTARKVQQTESLPPKLAQIEAKPEIDDDEEIGPDGLNMRRRLFVEHITSDALGNANKAARLAGYADSNANSLAVTASRLLSFANVQQAIAKRLAQKRLTPDAVRTGVAELCGADLANFIKVDADGNPTMDWKAAAANGAIGQIKEYIEEGIQADGEPVTVIKRKFKIYDRLKALELLGKMLGMLNEPPPKEEEPPIIRMRPVRRMISNARSN